MFDMPDPSTLRLSSFLASTAFCLVFAVAGWRQQAPWMRWWAAATGSYSLVLLGFEWAGEPLSPWLAAPLNGLLVLSMAFILAGIRAFDGAPAFARWMWVVVTGVAVVPAAAMAMPGEGWAMAGRLLLSLGLTIATFIFSWPLLAARVDDGTRLMRRLAGGAFLIYVPVYAAAMIREFVSADIAWYFALPPLLADQMMLGIANLSLLSIPGIRSQHQLRQTALRDPLTGAWNRAALVANAGGLLVPGRAVLLVDVDHFKAINDTHGHAMGDRVLVATTKILQRNADGGFVARLGGDEFLVVTSADDAGATADRIRKLASRGEPDLPPWTLSVGATSIEPGDRSIDDVAQRADGLMYQVKNLGRARAAVCRRTFASG